MKRDKFDFLFIATSVISLVLTIGIIIVAIHFIVKYW